jgi:hypothetical protein
MAEQENETMATPEAIKNVSSKVPSSRPGEGSISASRCVLLPGFTQ